MSSLLSVTQNRPTISSDQNEELMLSASDSEELDADRQAGASAEQSSHSNVTFEELLEVTRAVAKLSLEWPEELKNVTLSKLDNQYLTPG